MTTFIGQLATRMPHAHFPKALMGKIRTAGFYLAKDTTKVKSTEGNVKILSYTPYGGFDDNHLSLYRQPMRVSARLQNSVAAGDSTQAFAASPSRPPASPEPQTSVEVRTEMLIPPPPARPDPRKKRRSPTASPPRPPASSQFRTTVEVHAEMSLPPVCVRRLSDEEQRARLCHARNAPAAERVRHLDVVRAITRQRLAQKTAPATEPGIAPSPRPSPVRPPRASTRSDSPSPKPLAWTWSAFKHANRNNHALQGTLIRNSTVQPRPQRPGAARRPAPAPPPVVEPAPAPAHGSARPAIRSTVWYTPTQLEALLYGRPLPEFAALRAEQRQRAAQAETRPGDAIQPPRRNPAEHAPQPHPSTTGDTMNTPPASPTPRSALSRLYQAATAQAQKIGRTMTACVGVKSANPAEVEVHSYASYKDEELYASQGALPKALKRIYATRDAERAQAARQTIPKTLFS